jgi:proteasome lid subunit RPN8/RPN11
MISFLRRITQAFAGPKPAFCGPRKHFQGVLAELHRRGGNRHESGAFLLGSRSGGKAVVQEAVYYDDLDPRAYDSGVCILYGASFSKLWAHCRERRLEVVGDVHTHEGRAGQSESDRKNPMIAQSGHVALIVPRFARVPVKTEDLGIYEYLGDHKWRPRGGKGWRAFISFRGS